MHVVLYVFILIYHYGPVDKPNDLGCDIAIRSQIQKMVSLRSDNFMPFWLFNVSVRIGT